MGYNTPRSNENTLESDIHDLDNLLEDLLMGRGVVIQDSQGTLATVSLLDGNIWLTMDNYSYVPSMSYTTAEEIPSLIIGKLKDYGFDVDSKVIITLVDYLNN